MKKIPEEVEVLTPGYGSIYIGPFLKAMYGYNFTNILKSKYIGETRSSQEEPIESLMSSKRPFKKGVRVLLLDDNIGTGATMNELKESLNQAGIDKMITGAVQYNWRNYWRISVGEKRGIPRPDITEFDVLTPFNYAGHKLYKHAIDTLLSSGSEYIDYLKSKSYRKEEYSDIEGSIKRSATSASRMGMKLQDELARYVSPEGYQEEVLEEYKNVKNIENPISKEIIKRIVRKVEKENEVENQYDESR